MKTLLIATVALGAGLANAQVNNWTNAAGDPWRNTSGQCWRNSSWTPATAHKDCDGALKEEKVAIAPRVVDTSKPITYIAQRAPIPAEVVKHTYSADTLFDFDKSVLKPEGKKSLDDLVDKIRNINLEVVIAVGHTDYIGSDDYNMKLGMRRANAVKAYLIAKGIESKRVFTDSKGERQPIASNHTAQGRAKNRRVEIEVVGTAK